MTHNVLWLYVSCGLRKDGVYINFIFVAKAKCDFTIFRNCVKPLLAVVFYLRIAIPFITMMTLPFSAFVKSNVNNFCICPKLTFVCVTM